MANMNDYHTNFIVDQDPEKVFEAINNARGWWSGNIEGKTDRLDAEFTYEVPGVHWSKQKITELTPGKKVVWHVSSSKLSFTKAKNEWDNTDIIFEISKRHDGKTEVSFSHIGLVPSFECYANCSNAWEALVDGNLRRLIETGEMQSSPW